MAYRIANNINHECNYNSGGISEIYLLNIDYYQSCKYADDLLFDTSLVELINVSNDELIQLESTDTAVYTENNDKGIYKHSISTLIRSLRSQTTQKLLALRSNRYIVIYRTYNSNYFVFGLDSGASVSFTQTSGQTGDSMLYNLTLSSNSMYPLFEMDGLNLNLVEPEVPEQPENPEPKPEEPAEYQRGKIDTIYTEFSADPNNGGTWNTWHITATDWDTGTHEGWDTNGGEWVLNGINKQTLQTIEIGEHVFTRENFKFKYRQDHDDAYANVTQEQIDAAFATTPVSIAETYAESRTVNGAYTVCDGAVYDAVNYSKFYNNKNELKQVSPFKIPTVADWAQLFSMAPDTSYEGLLQFLAVKPATADADGNIIEFGGDEELPYAYDHIWDNNSDVWDVSGLHLVPSGRRYNVGNTNAGDFYAYRKSVGLRAANEDGTQTSLLVGLYHGAGSNKEGVALHTQDYGSTYHLASVRLCRRKTPEELGYQLYADTLNDCIIVTRWDDDAPTVEDVLLSPLPIGRLRGVAVANMNADKTAVTKPLSQLQALVEQTNTGNGRWDNFDNY